MNKRPYLEGSYFGLCPQCKKPPVQMDVYRQQFMVCREHRCYWCIGENLMTLQFHIIEQQQGPEAAKQAQEDNAVFLSTCEEVEPYYDPPTFREPFNSWVLPTRLRRAWRVVSGKEDGRLF